MPATPAHHTGDYRLPSDAAYARRRVTMAYLEHFQQKPTRLLCPDNASKQRDKAFPTQAAISSQALFETRAADIQAPRAMALKKERFVPFDLPLPTTRVRGIRPKKKAGC